MREMEEVEREGGRERREGGREGGGLSDFRYRSTGEKNGGRE